MAILEVPPITPQSTPVLDERGGDPLLPKLLSRTYWLYLNASQTVMGALAVAVSALQASVAVIQTTLLDCVRGALVLTHAGKIPKVSSAGTVSESSITDNGTTVAFTEPQTTDTGATPQNSQVRMQANALGMYSEIAYAADNINVGLDCAFVAGTWIAYSATIVRYQKSGGKLRWFGSGGNTVGNAGTFNALGSVDPATGFWRLGDGAVAGYAVDSSGDVNATGVYRVAGVAGLTVVIATAKLTGGGANGSMTFTGGILTAQVAAT